MSLIVDGESFIYYVNSENRVNNANDTDCNFSYYFQNFAANGFTHCVVLAASIPKSFYLVQAGENTFTLQENSTQVTVTVPLGNYNRTSLASTITSLLTSSSPNHWTYTITFPNINYINGDNGLYTFTVTGNSTQPSFIFTTWMNEQLGFNANSTNTFQSGSLTSTNVCNLSTETTLFLHSDIIQSSNGENVLQEMYANGDSSYSYINWINICPESYARPVLNNQSNIFRFYLTDENGNIMNTNGINVNFTLQAYKKTNILDLVKGFIKMLTILLK